jgi:hypothetical protein
MERANGSDHEGERQWKRRQDWDHGLDVVNNAQTVQFNGNALANSWTIRGGDFGYNSSGTMMHIFLHDMNWSSGNDGWQYHGSVQWERARTTRRGIQLA